MEEPHLLAAESARGYRTLATHSRSPLIIAPAIQQITPELLTTLLVKVRAGARLLLESGLCFSAAAHTHQQLAILKESLGLQVLPPLTDLGTNYITYSWPSPTLVRTFHAVTPVACPPHAVIASVQGVPVCIRKSIGSGQLIYFGSMLGPGLLAGERECHALLNALIASS